MYGNLLPVLAPKVPVLRRNKATRCGINSGTLTDPCIQQKLFLLYCELYLLLICNAYPLVIDIQDVAPGSYQIRPELLQTFQPSYASSIAWISSDYFEPLLLPQYRVVERRKRLKAIGWISGYIKQGENRKRCHPKDKRRISQPKTQ